MIFSLLPVTCSRLLRAVASVHAAYEDVSRSLYFMLITFYVVRITQRPVDVLAPKYSP